MVRSKDQSPFLLFLIPAAGSLALYIALGYFLEREESFKILSGYTLLFIAYVSFLFNVVSKKQVFYLLGLSLVFRLSLIVALPNLSDDFYRFIWDGHLILNSIHPYANVPEYYISNGISVPGLTEGLFSKLNSPQYFTIYPPVYQSIFAVSALIFPESIEGNILMMRLMIILAEAGTLIYIVKVLKLFKLPIQKSLIYALNPLVIIELTGNLHFEAILIFFLIASFYYFYKNKLWASAIFFSLAICTKLIPLIFLPLFIRRMGWKKFLKFSGLIAGLCFLMYFPLLSQELIKGLSSSLLLYFQKFEFNASFYYLVRELGFWIFGHNIIYIAGLALGFLVLIFVLAYSKNERVSNKTVYESSMWALLIYFLFATTLHPWYIIPLLALSIFTRFKFTVAWSFLIFFTYINYTSAGFSENLWIVFIEYAVTLLFLYFELTKIEEIQQFKYKLRLRFLETKSFK